MSYIDVTDYNAMKDKLMIQVIPIAENEDLLCQIPHMDYEDISIVYRFILNDNGEAQATILVSNLMLDIFGITKEQLHEDALRNSNEKFPASIKTINEVMSEITGVPVDYMPEDPAGLHIATCNDGNRGAGCIFYPGFLESAAERFGSGFFVIPSSIHEMILIPDDGNISSDKLGDIVKDVNTNIIDPDDKLSDTVYYYDARSKFFGAVGN